MSKYFFLVEGKADITFLRDFILHKYSDAEVSKKNFKNKDNEVIISLNDHTIKIVVSGGYTKIKEHLRIKLQELVDAEYNLIIIQDADNPEKQDGGVMNRIEYLQNVKSELDIDFKIFLFPNNSDDGDLESLLLSIVAQDKYSPYFSNYEVYAWSIKSFSLEIHCDELLQDKNKVFNFFQVYHGMDKSKEENRIYHSDFWDFTSEKLLPLNNFINEIIR